MRRALWEEQVEEERSVGGQNGKRRATTWQEKNYFAERRSQPNCISNYESGNMQLFYTHAIAYIYYYVCIYVCLCNIHVFALHTSVRL